LPGRAGRGGKSIMRRWRIENRVAAVVIHGLKKKSVDGRG
jgi:hypothetical protein